MFVPSLSWQNDRFIYINGSKMPFFAGLRCTGYELVQPLVALASRLGTRHGLGSAADSAGVAFHCMDMLDANLQRVRILVLTSHVWCGKRLFSAPFYTKNDRFAKTGSGQTYGKVEKRGAFSLGTRRSWSVSMPSLQRCGKRLF